MTSAGLGGASEAPAAFRQLDEDGTPVVIARGEIDVATSPELRRELYALIDEGAPAIVVDFGAVEFIDSSALGVLVGALKRVRERGGSLTVRHVQPPARRVFDITGLSDLLLSD